MKAQALSALTLGLSLSTALLLASGCAARADQTVTFLDDLDLAGMAQGWGSPQASVSVSGASLRVAGGIEGVQARVNVFLENAMTR